MKKDLISRSVLIDKLEKWKLANEERGYDTAKDLVQEMIELTKEQESVGGGWIPVSERYPNKEEYLKNDGRFIVADGNRVYQSIYDIYIKRCFRTPTIFARITGDKVTYEPDNRVIAWQPLPEPYKAESEE